MYANQKILNEYNYNMEKRVNLDKDILELNSEKNRLQEHAAKLDNWNKGELGKDVKKKLDVKARVEADNEQKKRRIKRAHDTQELKEENYKNDEVIKKLNDDKIDEEGITNLVKLQSENMLSNEKIETLTEKRNALFAQSKANAQKAWLESEEYKTLVDENIKAQNELNSITSATEQIEALNAMKKKNAESAYIMKYKTTFAGSEDTSLAAQISYLQTESEKLTNEVQQRTNAFSQLKILFNENPTLTESFLKLNPAIDQALSTLGANLSIEKLNDYINKFNSYVQQNPELRES